MDTDYLLVLCTCPSRSAADAIATAALEERLAACVNQVPGIRSLYRWKGRVESDDEILLLIKTTTASFSRLEATIQSLWNEVRLSRTGGKIIWKKHLK